MSKPRIHGTVITGEEYHQFPPRNNPIKYNELDLGHINLPAVEEPTSDIQELDTTLVHTHQAMPYDTFEIEQRASEFKDREGWNHNAGSLIPTPSTLAQVPSIAGGVAEAQIISTAVASHSLKDPIASNEVRPI